MNAISFQQPAPPNFAMIGKDLEITVLPLLTGRGGSLVQWTVLPGVDKSRSGVSTSRELSQSTSAILRSGTVIA